MKTLNQKILFFFPLIILLLYFAATWDLFNNNQLSTYDDPVIINPLYDVKSIADYFEHKKLGLIWDVQPIRDLSYILDIHINRVIPLWSFQKINFLIWYLTCIFFYFFICSFFKVFLSTQYSRYRHWILFFAILYTIHPVMQLGPFWLSSRKHLLSALFISISGWLLLKVCREKEITFKDSLLISFFYCISIFSHPITIFFPFFALICLYFCELTKKINRTNLFVLVGSLLIIMFSAAYLNYLFYHVSYPQMTASKSYKFFTENMTQVRLLTLGRFFYQIFDFTMASPFEHDRGSIRNIIGLLSLPIFIYIGIKKIPLKPLLTSLTWFVFPLILVILGDVKLFALDTYLIIASIGIIITLIAFCSRFDFHWSLYLIAFLFLRETQIYSHAFLDGLSLAKYAQEKEVTAFGQYSLATAYLNSNRFDEAFEESFALSKLTNNQLELEFLLPISLYNSKRISNKKKVELFEKWQNNGFLSSFYYSLLLPKGSYKFHMLQEKAMSKAHEVFKLPDSNQLLMKTVAYYIVNCPKEKSYDCWSKVNALEKDAPARYWDKKEFFHYRLLETSIDPRQSTKEISFYEKMAEVLKTPALQCQKIY